MGRAEDANCLPRPKRSQPGDRYRHRRRAWLALADLPAPSEVASVARGMDFACQEASRADRRRAVARLERSMARRHGTDTRRDREPRSLSRASVTVDALNLCWMKQTKYFRR